jgi:hypothetical protein
MKNIKTFRLLTLLFLFVTFNSCVEDDDYSIPTSIGLEENQSLNLLLDEINSNEVDLLTVGQVKNLFVSGQAVNIESSIAVKGYVVSSDLTGNFYKEFYIQDEPSNPTAGLKVVINQVDSYNQFNIGREVYIRLQNLYIGETNSGDGVIAIGGRADGNEVGQITENMMADYLFRSSNTETIIPFEVNLAQINDSHIGLFIQANDTQFPAAYSGLTFVDPSDDYDSLRDLESCEDSGSIKVETSAFASFQDRLLPTDGKGSISGVVTKSYNGDDRVLALNNIDDINFDGARCDPLFSDNFSSNNLDNWTQFSVEGEQVWGITPYGNPAPSARISGYAGGNVVNEDWLISNPIDLTGLSTAKLNFQTVVRYGGPALEVYMTTNYNGGDPSDSSWTQLDAVLDTNAGSWSSWTDSGDVDVSAAAGQNLYIAFKYTSISSGSATYEVDNVLVSGE